MKVLIVGNGSGLCEPMVTAWRGSLNTKNNYGRIVLFMNYWYTRLMVKKSLTICVGTNGVSIRRILKKSHLRKILLEAFPLWCRKINKHIAFMVTNCREQIFTFTSKEAQDNAGNAQKSYQHLGVKANATQVHVNAVVWLTVRNYAKRVICVFTVKKYEQVAIRDGWAHYRGKDFYCHG